MTEVKWIKIVTDIFDNRKIKQIEALPEGDTIIVIWFKILCLAGIINDNGNIYITKEIPYTNETLATQFNRPLTTIQLAMRTFQNFGMIEIVDDILKVSNWENYQNVEGLEKIKEQTRQRVAKHREKQKLMLSDKCNVTSNVTLTLSNDIDKNRIEIDKNRIDNIIVVYEQEIGLATPTIVELLNSYLDSLTEDMIIKAIQIASMNNKKNVAYIRGILNSWINKGYKVLADIQEEKKQTKEPKEIEQATIGYDINSLYEN